MISYPNRLYSLNLHLYAFQVADSSKKIEKQKIYQKYETLLQHFKFPGHKSSEFPATPQENSLNILRVSYQMTPQDSYHRFSRKIKVSNNHYPVCGSAYCKEIYDSYGLWFNLHVPERAAGSGKLVEVPIELLQVLNHNNQLIMDAESYEDEKAAFLGETLVLTVLLTEPQKLKVKTQLNYLKDLSDRCLNALFADSEIKPYFNGEGKLFGSPIFEYGLTNDFSSNRHILICFWSDKQHREMYVHCKNEMLELFFYRHKIMAAYQQSQSIHDLIADRYQQIKKQIDRINSFSGSA